MAVATSKGNRTVGIGMDYSPISKSALRWAISNLVDEGDVLIIIHVVSPKVDTANKQLFGDTGSPLIPLEEFREINVSLKYGLTPDPEVLDLLDSVSRTKGVQFLCFLFYFIIFLFIIQSQRSFPRGVKSCWG
ncbi:OLC1v1010301C1 [Oldenlandia corymbosa var. corymbosa]|uniref:OLC1v1010301C1 n=1 Tax=Oldenlandia corymbosa var. corymbosa TaxID=529605 RepID=A0AAV1DR26_OLDCO|nr:OLC1v1010301C1 [Oldenlandia corymbosa var. corymbosa]